MHADTYPIWTRARAMFARAAAMLGDAAAIAALASLAPQLRREIVAWLAPLEHVVRKLLLAEAAALMRANARETGVRLEVAPLRGMAHTWTAGLQTRLCAAAPAGCASEDPRSKIDFAHPESWRARFSFALPRPNYVPASRAPRIRALWGPSPPPEPQRTPRVFSAAPFRLARRFEALRRVFENPAPYAQRLADALAREAPRMSDIAPRYALAPSRSNDYDEADPHLGFDAMRLADEGVRAVNDSS